jgi:hypothetical protein
MIYNLWIYSFVYAGKHGRKPRLSRALVNKRAEVVSSLVLLLACFQACFLDCRLISIAPGMEATSTNVRIVY